MDKLSSWCVRIVAVLLYCLIELCSSQAPPSLSHALQGEYIISPSSSPFFPYCTFNGNPSPQISWSFNGETLPTDSSQGGPYYYPATGVLVLSGARSGMYTCTGENQFGVANATITITLVESGTPWYVMPYMWFIYVLVVWVICVILMILLFFYKKKRSETDLTTTADSWLGN